MALQVSRRGAGRHHGALHPARGNAALRRGRARDPEGLRRARPDRGRRARRSRPAITRTRRRRRRPSASSTASASPSSATGDAGIADGTLQLLGRGSACINTGGEKVYPEEVEQVLGSHPDVADCLVIGLPDERFGQRVVALVAARRADAALATALPDFVQGKMAGYKRPRTFFEVDSDPAHAERQGRTTRPRARSPSSSRSGKANGQLADDDGEPARPPHGQAAAAARRFGGPPARADRRDRAAVPRPPAGLRGRARPPASALRGRVAAREGLIDRSRDPALSGRRLRGATAEHGAGDDGAALHGGERPRAPRLLPACAGVPVSCRPRGQRRGLRAAARARRGAGAHRRQRHFRGRRHGARGAACGARSRTAHAGGRGTHVPARRTSPTRTTDRASPTPRATRC